MKGKTAQEGAFHYGKAKVGGNYVFRGRLPCPLLIAKANQALGFLAASMAAFRSMSAKSTFRTMLMRRRVSSVGFLNSCSTKLIMARDKPARAANSVMDKPR